MNTKKSIQRSFAIGDSWLYYKIYTGHKTADQILTEVIKPFTQKMLQEGVIDKWFFIRYSDPKFHLRIRFCLKHNKAVSTIIEGFNQSLRPYIKEELVWKFQIEDYHRELERYGHTTIEEAESLFLYDSQFVVGLLNLIEGPEGEELRWLSAIKGIDSLLNAFGYTLENKLQLTDIIKTGFADEFGMSRFLKKQLDSKYRTQRKKIEYFLSEGLPQNQELKPILLLIEEREANLRVVAEQLKFIAGEKSLQKSIDDLIASYIHMFMNRLFRSQNRKYELVIYDFLYRTYNSENARIQYQKSNKN